MWMIHDSLIINWCFFFFFSKLVLNFLTNLTQKQAGIIKTEAVKTVEVKKRKYHMKE